MKVEISLKEFISEGGDIDSINLDGVRCHFSNGTIVSNEFQSAPRMVGVDGLEIVSIDRVRIRYAGDKIETVPMEWVTVKVEAYVKRVSTQYDWKTAPYWATYAAEDADGQRHWFETEPHLHSDGFWESVQGRKEEIPISCQRWRDYIEKRPDQGKQSKYPWQKAPKWAEWAATDYNGTRYWYKNMPRKILTWVSCGGASLRIDTLGSMVSNPEETIEARPK